MLLFFLGGGSEYHFEGHTDCQNSELKSENVTFNDAFNGKK